MDFLKRQHNDDQDPFSSSTTGRFGFKTSNRKYNLDVSNEHLGESIHARLGRNLSLVAVKLTHLLAIGLVLLLVGKIYWLQVAKGEYYREMSEGNRIRIKRLEAQRGIIYDRNQTPLVHNVANFLLYIIPQDLPVETAAKADLIRRLVNIVGALDYNDIMAQLEKIDPNSYESFQPLFVADKIDYQKALIISLESIKMPGVFLDSRSRRQYNLPSQSFSHLLGYTGKINPEELSSRGNEYSLIDYIGKAGLEHFYESDLKGISGIKQVEVDALGKEKKILTQSPVIDGNSLVLSIDIASQVKLESIIKQYLEKGGFKKASAVLMDPNNGEVLALISIPAYDNNIFAQGINSEQYQALLNNPDRPLFSRVISGEFPSGSTIKPLMLAAALDSGTVTDNTSFLSSGGLRIGQWFFPDWKSGGHGQTDARKAIAQSVNTYFYIIGGGYQDIQGMGIDKMVQYFKLFGLGQQTGIDLPNEAQGFLPSKAWKESTKHERWYIGDTYHAAIGQGDLLVTPLQVAYYTAYFANGGKMYRPHLVKSILSPDNKTIHEIDTSPVRSDLVQTAYTQVVREGMRQAVTAGSSIRLNSLPVEAAGKTGTAQWSSKHAPHAWFTGFAPYDKPEIVITILVEEGEEGSRVAVPIADEFMRWYFNGKKPDLLDVPLDVIIPAKASSSEVSD